MKFSINPELLRAIVPQSHDEYMAHYQGHFQRGDHAALLSAVSYCLFTGHPAPEWVRVAWIERLDKWRTLEVRTLDEAFQVRHQKNKKLSKEKKFLEIAGAIFERICQAYEIHQAIDDDTFEAIGREFNISAGTVKNYYREYKELMDTIYSNPESIVIEPFP